MPKFRIVPLVLAFLMFMNGLGIYVIAFAQTGLHRLTEYVSAEKPTNTLSLSVSEWNKVNWIGSEDFVYNGNVYDLNSVITKGDRVTVSCHMDQEETTLKKNLDQNSNSDRSSLPPSFRDCYKFVSECDGMQLHLFRFQSGTTYACYPELNSDLNSTLIAVSAPPPRVA